MEYGWKLNTIIKEFQSGGIYTIISEVDGSVIDLADSDTSDGSILIAYSDNHGGDNQKFKVVQNGSGFTISSICQEDDCQNVWDYNVDKGTLEQYSFHGGSNQQFYAKEINPGEGTVKIVCLENSYCVQWNGEGKPLSMVEETSANNNQLWRLVLAQ